jgi:serine/threonine protein kinase
MYYTGFFNNNKIFIKVDTRYFLLINEINIRNFFKDELEFTQVINYKKGKHEYLFFNFIEYNHMSIENIKKNGIDFILSQAFDIVKKVNRADVLHRDIKLDNFLILNGNKVILNDFVYAISSKTEDFKEVTLNNQGLKLLNDLKSNSNNLYWDDMDSLYNEIKLLYKLDIFNTFEKLEIKNILNKIKNEIGLNFYKI